MIINMNGAKAPETPSSVLQEKTVTPETLPTVIGPDEGYDGLTQVTVNPDSQLIPTNIRSGKTIFGVDGTFEGGGNAELNEFRKLFNDTSSSNPINLTSEMFDTTTYLDPRSSFWSRHFDNIDLRGFSNILSNDSYKGPFYGVYTFDINNDSWHGDVHIECNMFNGSKYCFSRAWLYNLPTVIVGGEPHYRGVGMYKEAIFHTDNSEIVIDGSSSLLEQVFYNVKSYDPVSGTSGAMTFRFKDTFTGTIYGSSTIGNASYPSNIIMESATPPTMSSSSGFIASGINTITVPKGALSNYQNATNWSNYADKMVEASE